MKRIRKISKILLGFILIMILLESASFLVWKFTGKQSALHHWIEHEKNLQAQRIGWYKQAYGYHPYLGYMRKEVQTEKRDANKINIAILGGSVAEDFGRYLRSDRGRSSLKELIPEIEKFHLLNLASGGFKQPQTLITSLLFSEKFDLAISIEGHNEVFEHHQTCEPAEWPYFIHRFSSKYKSIYKVSGSLLSNIFLKLTHKSLEKSYFLNIFSYLTAKPILQGIYKLYKLHLDKFNQCPPIQKIKSINLWLKNLKKHHLIHQTLKVPLITILQPVPFLEHSKKLTAKELEYLKEDNKKDHHQAGKDYALAINEFNKLRSKTPTLFDMTSIFKNEEKTVYRDGCCHLNQYGNEILLKKVVELLKTNTKLFSQSGK